MHEYLNRSIDPSDEGAAKHLGLNPKNASYRRVKKELVSELLRDILLSSSPPGNDSQGRRDVYERAWKFLAVGMVYRYRPNFDVIRPFLKEALRIAEENDLPEVAYYAARQLRDHASNRDFNPRKYAELDRKMKRFRKEKTALERTLDHVTHLIYLSNRRSSWKDIEAYAAENLDEVNGYAEQLGGARFTIYRDYIEMYFHKARRDFGNVIEVGRRALEYLENLKQEYRGLRQAMEANLTMAYIHTGDYNRGEHFVRRLIDRTEVHDHNRVKAYELVIMLAFRSGNYQEAYRWYLDSVSGGIQAKLLDYYRETFDIFEGYLYLLIETGNVERAQDENHFDRFRINRFLNQFDHAVAEKSYRNVHLLIISVLHHIVKRQRKASFRSVEAIERYTHRHLNDSRSRRSKLFVNLLIQIPKNAFHRAAVERHADRYLKKLRALPAHATDQPLQQEIVPYEDLWHIAVRHLGYKRVSAARYTER